MPRPSEFLKGQEQHGGPDAGKPNEDLAVTYRFGTASEFHNRNKQQCREARERNEPVSAVGREIVVLRVARWGSAQMKVSVQPRFGQQREVVVRGVSNQALSRCARKKYGDDREVDAGGDQYASDPGVVPQVLAHVRAEPNPKPHLSARILREQRCP